MWDYCDSENITLPEELIYYCPFECIYCGTDLTFASLDSEELRICLKCGWWIYDAEELNDWEIGEIPVTDTYLFRACGTLLNLDVTDASVPCDELRGYLLRKYKSRFKIDPRKFEEIVGSVFANYGYQIRVTSYSGDEGIDVIVLDGDGDKTIGVQVKRYKGTIGAEQIRSFVGALYLKDITTGIFVATSQFTRGAKATAQNSCSKGIGIELWDAKRFYDALKITQKSVIRHPKDWDKYFFNSFRNRAKWFCVDKETWGRDSPHHYF
jgi:restriction system protein